MNAEPDNAAASRIAVIGAGYVGLSTAVCLAHLGNRVRAVDIDASKVALLSRAESPILEAGMPDLLAEGLASGRLSFTTDAGEATRGADFVFLCLPTPQGADGAADLRFVVEAARQISPHLPRGAVVVTKSTVPVGSASVVIDALDRPDVAVVSNPEFLREGTAVKDWLSPDRVVIGSDNPEAALRLAALYEPLGAPVVITDPASSETIKYASNAFLAAKISFVNSIANLCSVVGANVVDVVRGMSFDPRIGSDHLRPGPGWGGPCFPKDTSALIRIAHDHGYDFSLLKEVVAANERQFDTVASGVEAAAGGRLDGLIVAAWGLTFKAGTDDLRDSPSVSVIKRLRERGASVRAYDPTLPELEKWGLSGLGITVCDEPYLACSGASALVVLTEWPEFREADLAKAAGMMRRAAVVDTRQHARPLEGTRMRLRLRRYGTILMGDATLPVVAVVVNYNARDHLRACLASLDAEGISSTVVVDNASVDGSRVVVEESGASWVASGGNLGYGRAANIGAASPESARSPYLLVCNPDLVMQPGSVKALVETLERSPTVALVGPRIDNPDGSLYPSARSFPDLVEAAGHGALGLVAPGNRFTRRYRMLDWDHAARSGCRLGLRGVLPGTTGSVGRGRRIRSRVFHVHGGRRPVLEAGSSWLARHVPAARRRDAHAGGLGRPSPLPHARSAPSLDVALR